MKYLKILILFFFVFSGFLAGAQNDDKLPGEGKKSKSQRAWSVGVFGGTPIVMGDVHPVIKGIGAGLNINMALNNRLTIRLQGGMGTSYGIGNSKAFGNMIAKNPAVNGTYDTNLDYTTINCLYHNYKMTYKEAYLNGIFNIPLGDWKSLTPPKLKIYVFGGIGAMVFKTTIDQTDKSGAIYDYTKYTSFTKKKTVTELKKLLDGKYETNAAIDPSLDKMLGGYLLTCFDLGLGFSFKLSKRLEMFLEGRYSFTSNDYLDGQLWDLNGEKTKNNDGMILANLGLNIRLGKTENIDWFDNPEAMHYKLTLQTKRKVDQLTTDSDADGVGDYFDKDPYTPSGIAVDGSGKPFDIDRDGIPDYKDADPFTDKNAVVDSIGKEIDVDEDGVPDSKDLEPNTEKGSLVNFQGKTIKISGQPIIKGSTEVSGVSGTKLGFLPAIFFDFNNATIRMEYYNDILMVADALLYNPKDKIKIIGHTDAIGNPEYNLELGKRRSQAVANIMIAKGIKADRLILETRGQTQPLTEVKMNDANRLNRRVQFEVLAGGYVPKIDNKAKKTQAPPKDLKKKEDQKDTGKDSEDQKDNTDDIDQLFKTE